MVVKSSALGNPYYFTARRLDEETGLYYYRARMYDPTLGRFLQPDPIGVDADVNLYRYVLNAPTTYVDPYGLLYFISGVGGTFTAGTPGIDVSAGVVAGYDPCSGFNASDFVSAGTSAGFNLSGDVFAGFIFNGYEDVFGSAITVTLSIGSFSGTAMFNPDTGKLIGITAGIGHSATLLGLSGAYVNTFNTGGNFVLSILKPSLLLAFF